MTNTRKLATIAILSAISFLLMYLKFPLIPAANFLEVDFSIVPILIGLVTLDLGSAFTILILRSLLKLLLNGGPFTLIGLPMNIIAVGAFVLAMAYFWQKKPSKKSYLVAATVGTVGLTLAMLLLNYVYAIPAFAAFVHFDIAKTYGVFNYLMTMVLPFNLLQGVIFSVVFYVIYNPLQAFLKKV